MSCKIVIFLCLSLAILFVITSEVAAKDLPQTSASVDTTKHAEETNGLNDAKYGGGNNGGYPGGGNGGYPGGGNGGYPGGGRGGGGGGGYCRHGCCRRDYNGRGCKRCCSYAGEAVDAQTEAKPHN